MFDSEKGFQFGAEFFQNIQIKLKKGIQAVKNLAESTLPCVQEVRIC